jgi:small subunit ribosomal protein S14
MSKLSLINRNLKRRSMAKSFYKKRASLKAMIMDKKTPPEERFTLALKLAVLPRNSAKNRIRNRCALTGRARGVYSDFKLCRIELRNRASSGQIPGVTKSSW